jgi:O-antigen ligase
MLYVLLWSLRSWRRRKESMLSPAVALAYPAIFSLAMAAIVAVPKLRRIFLGNAVDDARVTQYKTGIPLILKHPWGYGIGMGGETLNYNPFGFMTIDTYYLDIALQFGIVGFLVFYGMIVVSIGQSAKLSYLHIADDADFELFTPIAISLVNFLVIKAVFSELDNHPLVFMMMGAVVALSYRMYLGARTNTQPTSVAEPQISGLARGVRA